MVSPKEKKPKPLKPEQASTDQEKRPFMRFYAVAFELVVMNVTLILGGYYLDSYLSTSPLIILFATFLAMAGTIWLLLKSLK